MITDQKSPPHPAPRLPLGVIAAVAAVLLYEVLFYLTPLAPLAADGATPRRFDLLPFLLFPEVLWESWAGTSGTIALADRMFPLMVAVLLTATAGLVGTAALSVLKVRRDLAALEQCFFALGIGLPALSLYTLIWGMLGCLQPAWLFFLPWLLLVAASSWWAWRAEQRSRHAAAQPSAKTIAAAPQASLLSARILGWIAVGFSLVIVWGALLPPIEFDVREYHLAAPKEFCLTGRVSYLPHNVYANMPLGAEMLSLAAMIACGDWWWGAIAGKAMIAGFAPLTALGLYTFGRRMFSPLAGAVAALAWITTPWVAQIANFGLVEDASACFAWGALYALLISTRKDSPETTAGEQLRPTWPWIAIAGWLAGGSVAIKYPAVLFVVLPLAACLLWHSLRTRGNASATRASLSWRSVALFLIVAVAAFSPWLIKNAIATGNPVYPLLYSLFDGLDWSAAQDARWQRVHLPQHWTLADAWQSFASVTLTSPWLQPLVVPLAVMGVISAWRRQVTRLLLANLLFVLAAWWLTTHRIDRFWIPILPLACLLAGVGTCWTTQRNWYRVLGIVGCVAIFYCVAAICGPGGYNAYFRPLEELRYDPARIGEARRFVNLELPASARLLLVGDAQAFDFERPVTYNTVFNDCVFEQLVSGRPIDEVRRNLGDFTHVYVDWGEIARYRSPGNYGFTDFVTPQVFNDLLAAGILGKPTDFYEGRVQIFPVQLGSSASEAP